MAIKGLFGEAPVKAGFTGNQDGMTKEQKRSVRKLLVQKKAAGVTHGDCVGSDADAHDIAHALGIPISIRPPVDEKKRAFKKGAAVVFPQKPYKSRNQDIVNTTTFMVATPRSYKEVVRSGTWSTVRYAVKQGKMVYVVYPDGKVVERTQNPELSTLEDSE